MSTCTIWHNPRCSKSRQTLALLNERGIESVVIEYLNTPPSTAEIKTALNQLGIKPGEMMRRGEKLFKELELAKITDDARLISAMHDHPVLIERPIVFCNGKAVIGRPPEKVLEIL